MTNRKLCQFNLRDNDLCENCQSTEDIAHLLFDCPLSFAIWESLKTWLTATTNKTYHFDRKSIILGNKDNDLLTNTLFLLRKNEIYKRKWKENIVNIEYLKRIFLRQMKVDLYIGTINNNLPRALGKWSPIHNVLITMQ